MVVMPAMNRAGGVRTGDLGRMLANCKKDGLQVHEAFAIEQKGFDGGPPEGRESHDECAIFIQMKWSDQRSPPPGAVETKSRPRPKIKL
jgi:hypothetical protein